MPFHTIVRSTFTSGSIGPVALSPNSTISPRAATEADAWAHFRVRSFKFRLHPTGSVANDQVAGYIGGVQDTAPTTIATAGELLSSCLLAGDATVPTEWCSPSKSELAGPLPWYKSVAGAADPTEESPGIFTVVGTGTDVVLFELRGVFEFKTSVATANTPLARAAHEQLRRERLALAVAKERAVLLKILAPGPPEVKSSSLMGTLPPP